MTLKMTSDGVKEFLRHSNYIEKEYSDEAFQSAINAWKYALGRRSMMTTAYILKVHKILMQKLNKEIAGKFRQCDVFIGGNKKSYISDEALLSEVKSWLKDFNFGDLRRMKTEEELEEIIKQRHIKFEKIHPFQDCNGRTGRILMNIERIKVNLPILIIHEGEEQMDYYRWFV